jgi:hypothetical protein
MLTVDVWEKVYWVPKDCKLVILRLHGECREVIIPDCGDLVYVVIKNETCHKVEIKVDNCGKCCIPLNCVEDKPCLFLKNHLGAWEKVCLAK